MSTVFVTGATGFIGTALVRELLRRGDVVHAICRHGKPKPPPGVAPEEALDVDHPNLKWTTGDITDRESLCRAMDGCSQAYHLAGYAKNWARDPKVYFDVNVGGMRNVFEAAMQASVERVVWTSTMLTFGPTSPGKVGDEQMPRTTPEFFTEYEASKAAAEREAANFVARGLDVVIVNPARVFGPGHLTEGNVLSQMIDQYDRGHVPFLLNNGRNVGNYVLVDDVVQGHLLAMERGRRGEKYLLGGDNVSLRGFFSLVDQVSGKRHFQIPIRRPAAMVYAWTQLAMAKWLGKYPQITPAWVRVFLSDWAFSSAKAQREWGYRPTPLAEAVERTYKWLLRVRQAA
jgi:nucleoside-diphosphate-sugar epimerase